MKKLINKGRKMKNQKESYINKNKEKVITQIKFNKNKN